MTKEELSKELEQLEPLECMELIRDALERCYPGCKFELTSYYIPEVHRNKEVKHEADQSAAVLV